MSDPRPLVIVNPAARGGKVGRRWMQLEPRLAEALGGEVDFALTREMGDGEVLARQAVEAGRTTLYSLGGDGTHGEVVNGIMRAGVEAGSVALGVLPAGTGGDLRRALTGVSGLVETAASLRQPTSARVDVGQITFAGEDGQPIDRFFINLASVGVAGQVDRLVNRSSKRLGGRLSFLLATLRAITTYQAPTVRLTLDGESLGERRIDNVIAGNSRYAGGGMMLAPGARMGDGKLRFVVINAAPLWRTLALAPKIYKGTHIDTPLCEVYDGQRLDVALVQGAAAAVDIDGESPGTLPITFSIRRAAIRLLNVDPSFL